MKRTKTIYRGKYSVVVACKEELLRTYQPAIRNTVFGAYKAEHAVDRRREVSEKHVLGFIQRSSM